MGRLLDEDDVIDAINKRISVLQKHPEFRRKNADIDLYGIKSMIAECPTQPEQRWIPVTERLPEEEYVLISKKPTKISGSKWSVAIAIRTADPRSGKIQWRDSGFGVIQDDNVLAWMPLPDHYQGGVDE